jgi:Rrf2 family iron-sulfur cluster assembly transcriptional regulator
MFSKACEYGIRATLYIAQQSADGKRVSLKEIISNINSPEAFTAKILQQLARSGIIHSTKGLHGGFEVNSEQMFRVRLSEIVDAIDGNAIYNGCGLGLERCNANKPCPLHDQFMVIRNNLKQMLESTTLNQLTSDLVEGITCLKR